MSDRIEQIVQKVVGDMDPFKKIASYIPGFKGYVDRQNRRDEDKVLRDTIANRFEQEWQRISAIQRDLISQGNIQWVDDVESAAIKIRSFIDKVKRAPRGYSGLFDAVKINSEELSKIYQYDASLLALSEDLSRAIDHVEESMNSDGFSAAIRNLVTVAQQSLDMYERRTEIVFEK